MGSMDDVEDNDSTDSDHNMQLDETSLADQFVRSECATHTFEEWATDSQSYIPRRLEKAQFASYYDELNWGSEHVTLLGSQENFCGPS
jgi:hypothetical protein